MTKDMSETEKRALSTMNRVLNRYFASQMSGLDIPPDKERAVRLPNGRRILLGEGQRHSYRYYAHGQYRFCYTTWKDDEGDYWSWEYYPVGKGSRSGKAKRWKMRKLVRAAKRKTAMARAERMREKASGG